MSEKKTTTPGAAVLGWWAARVDADNGAARKARAQLRRASGPAEVLAVEATHLLNKALSEANPDWDFSKRKDPVRLALIAATIAGIDKNTGGRLAARFGQTKGENRVLSHLRFQRILHAGDDWTLATRLRRALPIVGRSADVAQLGNDLFHWGDMARNRWCFDYFGQRPPGTPQSLSADDQETERPDP